MVLKDEPEVLEQAYQLYVKGKYSEAYDLLEGAAHKYPNWAQRIYEIRMDLAAMQGKLDLAEGLLSEALDQGYFYTDMTLRKDTDVASLQGRPRYESLVEKNHQLLSEEQKRTSPQLIVQNPAHPSGKPCPFLMALHGNNSNAHAFTDYWRGFVSRGWLVTLPQSSQVSGRNLYVWNNMEKADLEIEQHYQVLSSKFKIDPARSIICGFSKGGHEAIRVVFLGLFPVKGFIAVTPYVGDAESWLPLLGANKDHKIKGYFILGENDEHCTPGAKKLFDLMTERGIECGLEIFPGMGHEFPEDYELVLERAAQFLLK